MPVLRFHRPTSYPDRFRSYRLYVDGEKVGHVDRGETLEHDVAPGTHACVARIDWCHSPTLTVDVGSDDIDITVRPEMNGWKFLLAIWFITFGKGRYLKLESAHAS